MKITNTGTHIEGINNVVIQESQSQQRALAFVDKDGQRIHIDVSLVNSLYQFATRPALPPSTTTIDLTNPFND